MKKLRENVYAYFLDCGDGFMSISICLNSSNVYVIHVQFTVHPLNFNKAF